MYKCIIFDVDGTLIDTESVILKTYQELMKTKKNKHYEIEDLKFTMTMTGEDSFIALGFEDMDEATNDFNAILINHLDELIPFDGMSETIEILRENNVLLGVVTSRVHDEMVADFDRAWPNNYFEAIICADDTDYHKPHPEPLELFFRATGIKKEEAVYIGDTHTDAKCAKAAGVDFLLAGWGAGDMQDESYTRIETPIEILKYVNISK